MLFVLSLPVSRAFCDASLTHMLIQASASSSLALVAAGNSLFFRGNIVLCSPPPAATLRNDSVTYEFTFYSVSLEMAHITCRALIAD